jgi:hypothetical protein
MDYKWIPNAKHLRAHLLRTGNRPQIWRNKVILTRNRGVFLV